MIPDEIRRQIEREFACEHVGQTLTVKTASNGSTHYWMQCLRCGAGVKAVRKVDVPRVEIATISEFDHELGQAWYEKLAARRTQLWEGVRREARTDYQAYLQSDSWKQKRRLVLERADGRCEGCRLRAASEVHHISYAHVYDEFLFELVALCPACHDRWHRDHPLQGG